MSTPSYSLRPIFSFLFSLIKPYWRKILLTQILCLSWSLDRALIPYLFGKVVDAFTHYEGNRFEAWDHVKGPIILTLGVWIFLDLAFRLSGVFMAKILPQVESDARMTLYERLSMKSPAFFIEHMAGNIANRLSALPDSLRYIFSSSISLLIPAFVTILMAIYIFFFLSPLFALMIAVWTVLHLSLSFSFSRRSSQLSYDHSTAKSLLLGQVMDSITNYFSVRVFGNIDHEIQRTLSYQQEERKRNQKQRLYVEKVKLGLCFLTILIPCLGLNSLAYYYWMHNLISTGEVVTIFSTSWNISLTVWLVGINLPEFFREIGVSSQALTLIQPAETKIKETQVLQVDKGQIEFEKVYFQYPGAEPLFSDKSIKIHAGEKVGLVGYSGSGKTTFMNLILRLFDVQSGRILIDGQDIAQITDESLYKTIATVPQDSVLFHRTIKENISYGNLQTTEEAIIEAAQKAHAHEFIESLPQGYDTLVGERGIKLSAGQRQRIAIARAFLKNAPILILDEATSFLDSITENIIQESLSKLTKNKTTIIIAHRLSTLLHVDRILVFDKGKILEEGTHKDLLAKAALYKKLWENQCDGLLGDRTERLCA